MARKSSVPEIRKGITRDELLADTWLLRFIKERGHKGGPFDALSLLALDAMTIAVDNLVAYVNAGNRVTRKDVMRFFVALDDFSQVRIGICTSITEGKITPSLLDKLVQ